MPAKAWSRTLARICSTCTPFATELSGLNEWFSVHNYAFTVWGLSLGKLIPLVDLNDSPFPSWGLKVGPRSGHKEDRWYILAK